MMMTTFGRPRFELFSSGSAADNVLPPKRQAIADKRNGQSVCVCHSPWGWAESVGDNCVDWVAVCMSWFNRNE